MAFHDDTSEPVAPSGDRGVVFRRDGPRIKETAGVIELNLAELAGDGSGRDIDLPGDGPDRDGFMRGVLPKVAHQATPRTFPVGEEDRQGPDPAALGIGFVFDQLAAGPIDGQRRTLAVEIRTMRDDPCVTPHLGLGIQGRWRRIAHVLELSVGRPSLPR